MAEHGTGSLGVPVTPCLWSCGSISTQDDTQRGVPACVGMAACSSVHMDVHGLVALCGHLATCVQGCAVRSGCPQTFSKGVLAMLTCACLICPRTCSTEHPPCSVQPHKRWLATADDLDGISTCPCTAPATHHSLSHGRAVFPSPHSACLRALSYFQCSLDREFTFIPVTGLFSFS